MKKLMQILAQQGIAKIYFYDVIGYDGSRALDVVKALDKADEEGVEKIEVHINSPGGVVYEAFAIYNALKSRDNVEVFIDGLAASAASYVAMAGSKIRIFRNSKMMIHNPWVLAYGDEEDLKKMREHLQDIKVSLMEAYSRSGKNQKELTRLMDEETWYNADEMLAEGFADEVIDKDSGIKVDNIINQFFPKQGEDPMREYLIKLLGLKDDVSDEDLQKAVEALKTKADDPPAPPAEPDPVPAPAVNKVLEQKVEFLTDQVKDLVEANKKLAEQVQKEKAAALIAGAIKDGKIFPSQKDIYLKEAIADMDAFAEKLAKMPKLFDPEKTIDFEEGKPVEYASSAEAAVAHLRQKAEAAKVA